ncbi:helix-turn-helix transcriptional regulator [Reichenbachiella sp.]|uniref:helix-turn-helix domain-containing protein n=1 Tax=Reichenbachiella sp. TaxID=2184521 RepID=UPI003299BF93
MATLSQPKLGQTIISLRQEKKITQEELVERCNVSVRTLQRIEAGEVTPRESTLRIILDALEFDYQQMEKTSHIKGRLEKLKIAWICGIIYFITAFVEAGLDFYRFEVDLPAYFSLLYTTVKIVILGVYIFFMLGFAEVGKNFKHDLMKITAYFMLGAMIIIEIHDIISLFSAITEEEFFLIKGIESVAFGGINLAFGVALFKLGKELGDLSKIAGMLEMLAGLFFLTFVLAIFGVFVLIPATLLETILLYKVYDSFSNQIQNGQ